jgi:hypothetical protein
MALRVLGDINARNAWVSEGTRGADGLVRHKCFVSYHADDAVEALSFVSAYESVFIPKSIGLTDSSPFIDSSNNDYVMDKVRDDLLADSTVTIVLIGRCTWARKFVDWEVYSSLRRDRRNRLNGLLAVQLPSGAAARARLPERVSLNVTGANGDAGYARYIAYPTTASGLRAWIDDAFSARTSRSALIQLGGPRRINNSACT